MKGMGAATDWADKSVGTPSEYRFDLLPSEALAAVAELRAKAVARHGEDGIDDWRDGSSRPHLNKALAHVYAFLGGDDSEESEAEHLTHALCRLMFAVAIEANLPVAGASLNVRMGVETEAFDHALQKVRDRVDEVTRRRQVVSNLLSFIKEDIDRIDDGLRHPDAVTKRQLIVRATCICDEAGKLLGALEAAE